MEFYDMTNDVTQEQKVKYTLQCGHCKGAFYITYDEHRKGAELFNPNILSELDMKNFKYDLEYDHLSMKLKSRKDGDLLIIKFYDDEGNIKAKVQLLQGCDWLRRIIVGMELVECE